jgi:hypothetical protein
MAFVSRSAAGECVKRKSSSVRLSDPHAVRTATVVRDMPGGRRASGRAENWMDVQLVYPRQQHRVVRVGSNEKCFALSEYVLSCRHVLS